VASTYSPKLRQQIPPDEWADYPADGEVHALVETIRACRQRRKEDQQTEEEARSQLRSLMGNHSGGRAGKWEFFFAEQDRKAYEVPAMTIVMLRIEKRRPPARKSHEGPYLRHAARRAR
jgi:hypothetical protein